MIKARRKSINLLPWREEYFQKKSIKTLLVTGLISLLVFSCWFGLQFLYEQKSRQLSEIQQKLEQTRGHFSQVVSQIGQLRKGLNEQDDMKMINQEKIRQVMFILSALPLKKGTLSEFFIDEQRVEFKGNAISQKEFEQLHHFLEQYFAEVNLAEFIPNTDGNLYFEFELIGMHFTN